MHILGIARQFGPCLEFKTSYLSMRVGEFPETKMNYFKPKMDSEIFKTKYQGYSSPASISMYF
jgi:hypothetical protein